MIVEEFFDEFLSSHISLNKLCEGECLGLTKGCDICLVTSKYKGLVEGLPDNFKILPTADEESKPSYFLTGSYRRHTMIRPPKDVDLFIVLDSGEYQDSELNDLISPKNLLYNVKNTLEKIFEKEEVEIKIQQHSVCIILDEMFSIDVIPAFETDDKKFYRIPDLEGNENGKYIISNPKLHYEHINKINDSTSVNGKKRFKKVVRLLKFLKTKTFTDPDIKIRSFHFELLAAKILEEQKINSYADGINNFLRQAANYFDKASILDPANNTNKIDDYIDELTEENKNTIKAELHALSEIAQEAVEYENLGQSDNAIEEWKKIFSADNEEEQLKEVSLGDTSHALPLQWPFLSYGRASIDAYIYLNSGGLRKLGGINSDGRQLRDGLLLKYISKTNISEPYGVKWQVVNTGPHAKSDNGLRGGFFNAKLSGGSPSQDKHINWETTKYTGKHWIECFIIKNGICVAKSGKFYVNIRNYSF